jgi:anti-sigma factor RsiW
MNCDDALRLLNDYVDVALPLADFTRMESHMQECNCCATVFATTQIVVRIYRGLEVYSLSEGSRERIQRKILNSVRSTFNARIVGPNPQSRSHVRGLQSKQAIASHLQHRKN